MIFIHLRAFAFISYVIIFYSYETEADMYIWSSNFFLLFFFRAKCLLETDGIFSRSFAFFCPNTKHKKNIFFSHIFRLFYFICFTYKNHSVDKEKSFNLICCNFICFILFTYKRNGWWSFHEKFFIIFSFQDTTNLFDISDSLDFTTRESIHIIQGIHLEKRQLFWLEKRSKFKIRQLKLEFSFSLNISIDSNIFLSVKFQSLD